MLSLRHRGVGVAAAFVFVLGACTSGASPSASSAPSGSAAASAAGVTAPAAIKSAGKIVWCSDVSYAPEEFYAADGQTAQGSDVDIAAQIATYMGVTSEVDNTGFDGIIPALKAKKCDAIISGMNSTDERKKEVDFVDYLKVGQGLLVPAGNPKGIHTLDDLSGKSVAVQLGTTNEQALKDADTQLKAAGKAGIDIQTFQADTDAFQQLKLGRVDCYSTDSPVVAYYNSLPDNKGKYEIGGTPIAPAPIGIAVRKDDPDLKTAISAAVDQMYADGSLKTILAKWGMTDAVVLLK